VLARCPVANHAFSHNAFWDRFLRTTWTDAVTGRFRKGPAFFWGGGAPPGLLAIVHAGFKPAPARSEWRTCGRHFRFRSLARMPAAGMPCTREKYCGHCPRRVYWTRRWRDASDWDLKKIFFMKHGDDRGWVHLAYSKTCPMMMGEFKAGWRVINCDSKERVGENGVDGNVIDGDGDTCWHTQWTGKAPMHPHWIMIDLGQGYRVSAASKPLCEWRVLLQWGYRQVRDSGQSGRQAVSRVAFGTFRRIKQQQIVHLSSPLLRGMSNWLRCRKLTANPIRLSRKLICLRIDV